MLLVMASKLVRVRWKEGKTYILTLVGIWHTDHFFRYLKKTGVNRNSCQTAERMKRKEINWNQLREENKSTYEVTSNRKPPPLPELWSVTKRFDQWRQYPNRLLTCIIKLDLVGSGRWLRPSQTYIGNHEQKVALISYEKAAKGQDIS